MNASQRRKAYRSIDLMVGKNVTWTRPSGSVSSGVVLGRTRSVHYLSSTSDDYTFNGFRPSVHRVSVRLDTSGSNVSPRISQLRPV